MWTAPRVLGAVLIGALLYQTKPPPEDTSVEDDLRSAAVGLSRFVH